MKFEYQLTRKDLGDFNPYYHWKNKLVETIVSVVILATIFFLLLSDGKKFNPQAGLIAIGIGVLFYFIVLQRQLRRYGQLFMENGLMLAKKEIELSEEYFSLTDIYSESKMKWEAFIKLEIGKHAIYLFMETPAAIIIPRSAFADQSSCDELINYINKRLHKAIPE